MTCLGERVYGGKAAQSSTNNDNVKSRTRSLAAVDVRYLVERDGSASEDGGCMHGRDGLLFAAALRLRGHERLHDEKNEERRADCDLSLTTLIDGLLYTDALSDLMLNHNACLHAVLHLVHPAGAKHRHMLTPDS